MHWLVRSSSFRLSKAQGQGLRETGSWLVRVVLLLVIPPVHDHGDLLVYFVLYNYTHDSVIDVIDIVIVDMSLTLTLSLSLSLH